MHNLYKYYTRKPRDTTYSGRLLFLCHAWWVISWWRDTRDGGDTTTWGTVLYCTHQRVSTIL